MLDPTKLLGNLLQSGLGQGSPLSGTGLNLGNKAALGMGVLGVAMAAFEHFTNKDEGQATAQQFAGQPASQGSLSQAVAPPPPPGATPTAPPPPPPGAGSGGKSTGGKASGGSTPGGGKGKTQAASQQDGAVLLIRAMIAAANADGTIDQNERNAIINRLGRDGLDPEEVGFLEQELAAPKDLMEVVGEVKDPSMAQQVFAVSLLAVADENRQEQSYLRMLGSGLGLSEQDQANIRSQIQSL